ncbi:MAG TPA: family 16 glycoside hydrolase [Pirellulales bacterium]|nr:family 16 glycoside hydrolase [Pirellulales bacterium]
MPDRHFCLLLLALLLSAEIARPDDQTETSLSLLTANRLAGWDYGKEPPSGWKLSDGVLSGDDRSTPLVSGWSWQDAEFRFRWQVRRGGQWQLRLLKLSTGDEIARLLLAEADAQTARASGNEQLMQITEPAAADGWHQSTLRRRGDKLEVAVDTETATGTSQSQLSLAIPGERFVLELSLEEGAGALAGLQAIEPAGSPIFNGRDLTGWWTPGNLASWKVEDRKIVCLNQNGNYLRTEREYANFTLSLEYKMARGGNSGIGIRTARGGWPSGDGMELQLLDEPADSSITRHSMMAIYGNLEPLARADRRQQWNQVTVRAEGYLISAWVNGVLVQQADTSRLPELRRRPLRGWIGLQDHGARVEFRNLRVLELPSEAGRPAWQTPSRESASQLVLERLMNSERLAIADGLGSGTVTKAVKSSGEQVLAELTGPAAVVEVSRTNNSGRLSFYFDGETSPRIDCLASELHQRVAQVGQDVQPLLTFIPFRKSLKVVLHASGPAEYRLDYVTFPSDVPVEDFSDRDGGVARGLLPALSYRNEQLGWGTHREADPLPRSGLQNQKINEADRATLVELTGAGIVEWTKLVAAPSLLEDDDLWLEVTFDGEPQPALAAPARYFFPGLHGGNYPNYVVLDRGGWTNLLAMPYRSGLTIAVSNHGRRPVSPVGVTVSHQPLDDPHDPRLAHRLRGVYSTHGDPPGRAWITQNGRGRWIGLVTQYGKAVPGVEALIVDGQSRDGWKSNDLRTFMGIEPRSSNERHSFCGRYGGFQWRFFLPAPIDFERSLELRSTQGPQLGDRLALFYMTADVK